MSLQLTREEQPQVPGMVVHDYIILALGRHRQEDPKFEASETLSQQNKTRFVARRDQGQGLR
jgi:hypothetical protein